MTSRLGRRWCAILAASRDNPAIADARPEKPKERNGSGALALRYHDELMKDHLCSETAEDSYALDSNTPPRRSLDNLSGVRRRADNPTAEASTIYRAYGDELTIHARNRCLCADSRWTAVAAQAVLSGTIAAEVLVASHAPACDPRIAG